MSLNRDSRDDDLDLETAVELEPRSSDDDGSRDFERVSPPPLRKRINVCYVASAMAAVGLLVIFAIIVIVHIANAPPKATVVVLISIDGFSYDYLKSSFYPTPNLDVFKSKGVTAQSHPQFPTKTFPNHYSMITGLVPEDHGIVGNEFYDPKLQKTFSMYDAAGSKDPAFWLGDPLWNVANRSGLITASYFWPGSEVYVNGSRPNYVKVYNVSIPSIKRVEQVLSWLDLPSTKRPSFITLYFSDVDTAGHRYGPGTAAVAAAVADTDSSLGVLFYGLQARMNVLDIHTIIVSDHGMQTIAGGIFLDQYLSSDLLNGVYMPDINTACVNVWPYDNSTIPQYMAALANMRHGKAYLKENVPARLNFNNSDRIAPIVIIADIGYLVTTTMTWTSYPSLLTGGSHGWDPINYNMTGIFIAQGSRFVASTATQDFQNVDVYNIVADILNIMPPPNNGTVPSGLLKAPSPVK